MRHGALGVLRRFVLSVLVLIALCVGAVYARTAWILGRTHDVAVPVVALNTAVTDAAEARRFTIIIGCLSCHGRSGGGGRMSMPGVFELGAPNLTKVLPMYSDAEVVRLLRAGVRRDGRAAAEGQGDGEEAARIDAVGEAAADPRAGGDAGEDDPDDPGEGLERHADVGRHQPAGEGLEHEHAARGEEH